MTRLINNAKAQYAKFGEVSVIYYPDRYNPEGQVHNMDIDDAIDMIMDIVANGQDDDIRVEHPNSI
jgi:hypothetical protein